MKKCNAVKYIIALMLTALVTLSAAACFGGDAKETPSPAPDDTATAEPTKIPDGEQLTATPAPDEPTAEPTAVPGQEEHEAAEQEAAQSGTAFTFLDGEKNIYAGTIGEADADIIIIPDAEAGSATVKFMSEMDTPSYRAELTDNIMKYSDDSVRFTIYQQADGTLAGVRTLTADGTDAVTEVISLKYMRTELTE